ncbi:MAG: ABC transporter permease [Candidatus Aenigmatarchaeota archaeon]
MKFYKDLKIMSIAELKRFFRWKERFLWEILGSLIGFMSFILVWRAVLMGGFQGLGGLTRNNYITFLLSGSLLWAVINVNFRMSGAFVREKHQRTLPNLMISPVNKLSYLFGKLSVGLARVLIRDIAIVMVAATFFSFSVEGNPLLILLIFVITFIGFSGIGIIVASLSAWREGFQEASMVIQQILYLVSGVHYPIEVFPENIRNVVLWFPTTQAINAVRAVGLRGAGVSDISFTLGYVSIFSIVSIILGYFTFKWAKDKAMLIGI